MSKRTKSFGPFPKILVSWSNPSQNGMERRKHFENINQSRFSFTVSWVAMWPPAKTAPFSDLLRARPWPAISLFRFMQLARWGIGGRRSVLHRLLQVVTWNNASRKLCLWIRCWSMSASSQHLSHLEGFEHALKFTFCISTSWKILNINVPKGSSFFLQVNGRLHTRQSCNSGRIFICATATQILQVKNILQIAPCVWQWLAWVALTDRLWGLRKVVLTVIVLAIFHSRIEFTTAVQVQNKNLLDLFPTSPNPAMQATKSPPHCYPYPIPVVIWHDAAHKRFTTPHQGARVYCTCFNDNKYVASINDIVSWAQKWFRRPLIQYMKIPENTMHLRGLRGQRWRLPRSQAPLRHHYSPQHLQVCD